MNINWPFQIDARGRTATAGNDDHIRQLIEQLLFTNPGERVNRPTFGGGVIQLVFAPNSDTLAAALRVTVQSSLQQWLQDLVEIQELDINTNDATLSVAVSYINRANRQRQTVQFERSL
jgi:phage baseplate assembly protein W